MNIKEWQEKIKKKEGLDMNQWMDDLYELDEIINQQEMETLNKDNRIRELENQTTMLNDELKRSNDRAFKYFNLISEREATQPKPNTEPKKPEHKKRSLEDINKDFMTY